MDVKSKLEAIRVLLGVNPMMPETAVTTEEPSNTQETEKSTATAKDGTLYSWDGELAVGTELTMTTPQGEQKAQNGAIEFEDGTIIEVADGKVTNVTSPAESPAPDQGMTAEAKFAEMKQKVELAADLPSIAAVLKYIFNDMYGWKMQEAQRTKEWEAVSSVVQTFNAQKSENEALKTELANIKQAFSATVEIVEAMNEKPDNKPKTPVNAFFTKQNNEDKVSKLVDAFKNLK